MPVSKHNNISKVMYDRHVDVVTEKLSYYTAHQFCGIVIRLYMKYVIEAVLHGYIINIRDVISFSLSRIPVKEIYKYRGYKFKSNLTSDWLFFIDMQNKTIQKNDLKYVPSKDILRRVRIFLNTEKVYELIR